jgi:hypothetical protein
MKKILKIVILSNVMSFFMCQAFAQIDLKKAQNQVKKEIPNLPKKDTDMNKNEKSNNSSQNPEDTTSPAKGFIKQFWNNIEKLENMPEEKRNVVSIGNYTRAAQTAINNIKMKDKNYNTALLEAEVQKWENKYDEANANRGNVRATRTDAVAGYTKLFDRNSLPYHGDKPEQIAKSNQQIAEYKSELAKYLATNKDPKVVEDFMQSVNDHFFADLDNYIAKFEDYLKNGSEVQEMYGCLQYLLIREAQTDAAKQVYPNNPIFAKGHQKVQAAINRANQDGGIETRAKANAEKILREARVPAAITSNSAIEQEFKNAFAKTGWGETILKINLLNHDWTINRNELTSVIENRIQEAAIVTKNAKGKCIVYMFTIGQDYTGGGTYGSSYRFRHNGYEILCENVK